ncbi:acetyl-CoA carboxylase biotin carboxyl carrier protein subunit [Streptococcus penaeicida]|uniref:Biotin carboxyl carrier protein of acetyl-CoA carboxylase n=1 Tax=Streptococcus penaeicida TaxID=1765960 RepID=A0A2N8LE18_9STRE|nr:acetyl-CoA carboxylase biotin carboxyl carrier protein [Streptococcus penaeicida]PND48419.1 acetyl-CoA carboxylase biotin carboxyl carrier protein subunit [Streptococcus penaeicida]
MDIQEIKDLMRQFDQSELREFSYKVNGEELSFSKNELKIIPQPVMNGSNESQSVIGQQAEPTQSEVSSNDSTQINDESVQAAEGDLVESPLVGVAYLSPGPGKDNFVSVGSQVKKGQTLMIIEAMKVMNEIPAPKDGIITEILVSNEEVLEFGSGLVRLK